MPRDQTVRRIAEFLGEDFEFLMAHTDTSERGYGAVFGRLMSKLSDDQVRYLDDLSVQELHQMIGEHAIKYAADKRKADRRQARPPPKSRPT